MRTQIRGLNQGLRNAQDGISLMQTAEGALNEVHVLLQRMRELTVQAGSTRTSVQGMGALTATASLDVARLATALAPAAGSFTVNGTTIAYDATVDSLQNVINRVNQSAAGVTALYDAYNDTFSITSDTTGSAAIGLADVTGNFLASMGVLGAQTLGVNAQYSINGGATQYATTNQISDAITGVMLTLKETTVTAVSIEVFANNALIASRIEEFVEQYNSLAGQIRDFTEFVDDGANGILFGDGTMRRLAQGLRSLATGSAPGLSVDMNSFAAIGLTFGGIGSAIGTTNDLTFNRATFDAAVASDPASVRAPRPRAGSPSRPHTAGRCRSSIRSGRCLPAPRSAAARCGSRSTGNVARGGAVRERRGRADRPRRRRPAGPRGRRPGRPRVHGRRALAAGWRPLWRIAGHRVDVASGALYGRIEMGDSAGAVLLRERGAGRPPREIAVPSVVPAIMR